MPAVYLASCKYRADGRSLAGVWPHLNWGVDGRSSAGVAFNSGPLMNGRVAGVGFSVCMRV